MLPIVPRAILVIDQVTHEYKPYHLRDSSEYLIDTYISYHHLHPANLVIHQSPYRIDTVSHIHLIMESINQAIASAKTALGYGNETAGQEPISGAQGAGTATQPYDRGNESKSFARISSIHLYHVH